MHILFRCGSVALLLAAGCCAFQADTQPSSQTGQSSQTAGAAQAASGQALFLQRCAFCHGRDAGGGETGPDLTNSKLVSDDVNGDKIGNVVRNGRPEKGMPAFNLSDQEITALSAFIHDAKKKADSQQGGRKGVDVSDLQSGNAEAGKTYFDGAGGCSSCHSASSDLAGIAIRYQGLKLEERMLYPKGAKSTATVTLSSGQTFSGKVNYKDEFTIGVIDNNGWYRSFPTKSSKVTVDNPVQAHVSLLSKYTDDDIHNLMAYLQTLR